MKKTFFLLIGGLLISSKVICSDKQNISDTVDIEEIVVTATKTKRDLKQVPGKVSLINAKTIQATPAMQVDDVLRYTTGLNVHRTGGIYSMRPSVTLRGLSGDEQARTLVLMNGVPINTSDEGGVNWNRINFYDIERIEVFKGPGSSLYGNNAMGGVINIITKKPEKPQEIYGGIGYGTFNTFRQDLNASGRTKKGYYGTISQFYVQSDGYNNVPKADRSEYDIARPLDEIGVSARAGYDRSEWLNWELQYDIYRDKRGEGYQIHTPQGVYRNFNTNLLRGSLNGGNNKLNYDLNLFYQMEHYYDVNEKMRGSNYSRYDVSSYREDFGGMFSTSANITDNNTLTGGLEFRQGSVDGGDYYQTEPYDSVLNAGKIQNMAVYLQDEHGLLDNKIRLVAGLRFDHVRFFDGNYYTTDPWNTIPELKNNTWTELSPRLGARFNFIDEVSAYLTYSHGFRASILDDLTRTGWMWVGPKYANPELGPESMDNYELGFDIMPDNRLKVSHSFYYATGNDFLYYVATGDSLYGRNIYKRQNVTNVTMQGAEVSMDYKIAKGFDIKSNYTYSESKIDEFTENPALEGKYLKYVPKHKVSVALFWQNKFFNASILGLYKGEQFANDENTEKIDPYYTIDLHIAKKLFDNYMISLNIHDLFDNKYMETVDRISPGRIINVRGMFRF
jgi:iron complex outermembrane receptor protein